MITTIIEAISAALDGELGDLYGIHMEEIGQGLKEPCFFISCLNPTSRRFLKGRYFRVSQFCIQYFPETREKRRECYRVGGRPLGPSPIHHRRWRRRGSAFLLTPTGSMDGKGESRRNRAPRGRQGRGPLSERARYPDRQ